MHEGLLGLNIYFSHRYFHLIFVDFLYNFLILGEFIDGAIIKSLSDTIAENYLVHGLISNNTFLDLDFAVSQILLGLFRLTLLGRNLKLFDHLFIFFGERVRVIDLWSIHKCWWTVSTIAGSLIVTWISIILLTSRCDRVLVEERILGV